MAQAKIEKRQRKAIARLRKKTLAFVRNLLARTGRILAHSAVGGMFLVATSVPAQETMEHGIAEVKATLQQAAGNATPAPDAKTGGGLGAIPVQRTLTIRIEKTAGQKGAEAGNEVSLGSENEESNWWWNYWQKYRWVLGVALIILAGGKFSLVVFRLIASYLFDVILPPWGRSPYRPPLPIRHEPDGIYAQQQEIKSQEYRQGTLLRAVTINNASQIEKLVREGADVNTWENGITPLTIAAHRNATAAIAKLVELGADVDMPNEDGFSPLDIAVFAGSANGILKLVELGANINGTDLRESTPFHRAAFKGNLNSVRALLRCGADINVRDEDGWTPMHYAACSDENGLLIDYLYNRGADINARGEDGHTPAHLAALCNCPAVTKALWARDANINAKANHGGTPYDIAETKRNFRVLFRIIMCGGKKGKDLPPDTAAK